MRGRAKETRKEDGYKSSRPCARKREHSPLFFIIITKPPIPVNIGRLHQIGACRFVEHVGQHRYEEKHWVRLLKRTHGMVMGGSSALRARNTEAAVRAEGVRAAEAALIFAAAALRLAAAARRAWPNRLMPAAGIGSRLFKERNPVTAWLREPVDTCRAVAGRNTRHGEAAMLYVCRSG